MLWFYIMELCLSLSPNWEMVQGRKLNVEGSASLLRLCCERGIFKI